MVTLRRKPIVHRIALSGSLTFCETSSSDPWMTERSPHCCVTLLFNGVCWVSEVPNRTKMIQSHVLLAHTRVRVCMLLFKICLTVYHIKHILYRIESTCLPTLCIAYSIQEAK